MANGFGSFWVGNSGLSTAQNAMNITANNLTNVDTNGYVRQQVLQSDKSYNQLGISSAVTSSKVGLGVGIAEVVHTRDMFLDKYYRTENGRQNFYSKLSEATTQVETIFQELEGSQFQTTLTSFYEAMAELAKDPSDSINQNLIVQKGSLLIERAQSVYDSLKDYQQNLNVQVDDLVDTVNGLGEQLADLNKRIAKIEAGGVETAYDLRDERDNVLDELSQYIKIEYEEKLDKTVTVKAEGVIFVEGQDVDRIETYTDDNGYDIPYWTGLSNLTDSKNPHYYNVYNVDKLSYSTDKNTDIGELKALLIARGTDTTDYSDILGVNNYADSNTSTCLLTDVMARLDNLVHTITTEVNNLFSPLSENIYVDTDTNPVTAMTRSYNTGEAVLDKNGNQVTDYYITDDNGNSVKVQLDEETGKYYYRTWDSVNGCMGSTLEAPGEELFSRAYTDRYTEAVIGGQKVYVYNEEDETDAASMYSLRELQVNSKLMADATLLPFQYDTGDVDMDMASKMETIWSNTFDFGGDSIQNYTFMSYYNNIIDVVANKGSVYASQQSTLEATSTEIDNQRQQIIAVSSDEELSNMIRYQNAYNAASRYINVINEMTELITQLI